MKKVIDYLRYTIGEYNAEKDPSILLDAAVHFPQWLFSDKKPAKVGRILPWMNYGVIRFFRETLSKTMRVFEYGSGSSTIFLALRTAQVVSIEHHPAWHGTVEKMIQQYGLPNIDYNLILPENKKPDQTDFTNPHHYLSGDEGYLGKSFVSYAMAIDGKPDNYFDVVIVDGRARPSCILHGAPKVKPGGYLIIDDTERDYYLQYFMQNNIFDLWARKSLAAHVPGMHSYGKTTILQKPVA